MTYSCSLNYYTEKICSSLRVRKTGKMDNKTNTKFLNRKYIQLFYLILLYVNRRCFVRQNWTTSHQEITENRHKERLSWVGQG